MHRPAACSSEACFCFPPHPQGQPPVRLLTEHQGTEPTQALPPTAHPTGHSKEQRAMSPQPEKLVLAAGSGSSPERPHLMPQSRRRAARTRKRGRQSWGPGAGALLPHQVNLPSGPARKPAQPRLTLHGKYWSSRRPIPRHPRMFLPQTNSSPLSAKKGKWWLGWDEAKGKSPRRGRVMRTGVPEPGTDRVQC